MPVSEPLVVNAGLALMGVLLMAALASLWHLNLKVTQMYGVLCNEEFGVVSVLQELRGDVKHLAERVGALERGE